MIATLLEADARGLQDAIQALDAAADAFEIRFDALQEPVAPATIRAWTHKPLVATARRPTEGGQWRASEEERVALLDAASLAGFELVDFESEPPHLLAADEVLRSHHDLSATPPLERLLDLGHRMGRAGSHVKIATRVNTFQDTVTLLRLTRRLLDEGYPTSVMGLGPFPRLVPHLMGCEFVYGGGRTNAPGQPPLSQLRDQWRHWGSPKPSRHLFLVVGHPVDHSLSPRLFNAAFETLGQSASYGALEVASPADLATLVSHSQEIGIQGLNVTSPLKEAAFALATEVTPEARAASSANCLRITPAGILAHNTDGIGMRNLLHRFLKPRPRVLILGAGGAARGILAARDPETTMSVAARNPAALERVAKDFHVPTIELGKHPVPLARFDCVINATTSLDPIPLPEAPGALVDLHYSHHPTPWHAHASRHRIPFADGRELLVEQAVPGFEFLTGWKAPPAAFRKVVEAPA